MSRKQIVPSNCVFFKSSLQFELIMVYWIYAYSLMNLASSMIEGAALSEIDTVEKEVSNIFRKAAGVLENQQVYITICTKLGMSIRENFLPESIDRTAGLLSKYCIACAQIIFIKVAITFNKAPNVIARLCVKVYKMFDKMKEDFDSISLQIVGGDQTNKFPLNQQLATHINEVRILMRVLTSVYMAQDVGERNKTLAASFLFYGRKQLDEFEPFIETLQDLSQNLVPLKLKLRELLDSFKDKFSVLDESKDILPLSEVIKEIPEGMAAIKSVPFDPQPAFSSF